MLRVSRILKGLFIGILVSLAVLYGVSYVIFSIPSVQKGIADMAEKNLSSLLDTDVSVEEVRFYPMNRVIIRGINVLDREGKTLLYAENAGVSLSLWELFSKKIVINTININSFDIAIVKYGNNKTDTNIQFLIDKFKGNGKKESPHLRIGTLLLKNGNLSYDNILEPYKETGRFDRNHIEIKDFLINASLKAVNKDSVNINLRALRFTEKSGFSVKSLAFKLIGNKDDIRLGNFALRTENSFVQIKNSVMFSNEIIDEDNFAENTEIIFDIEDGIVVLSDFAPFFPALKGIETPAVFSCSINGPINHLNMEKLSFSYGNGIISATGRANLDNVLPNPSEAFIFGKLEMFEATPVGVVRLAKDLSVKKINNDIINNIGNIRFSGEISGFISKLVMFGKLTSDIGSVNADMLLARDNGINYKGGIKSDSLNIAKLLPGKRLGNVGFNLILNGASDNYANKGKVSGCFRHLQYCDYEYDDINIDGRFYNKSFNGEISLNDSNAVFSLNGKMDFSRRRKVFGIRLKGENIHVNALNLTDKYAGSTLNFDIDADFMGERIDDADGAININSFSFENNGLVFRCDTASIKAQNSVYPQSITVSSNIIRGKVAGKYLFSSLKGSFMEMLADAAPALTINDDDDNKKRKAKRVYDNNFSFGFDIPNTMLLSHVFELPFTLKKQAIIDGYYCDSTKRFSLICGIPDIAFGKLMLKETDIRMEKFDKAIFTEFLSTHTTSKGVETAWMINSSTSNDNTLLDIEWSNANPNVFSGTFSTTTHFIDSEDGKLLDIAINPSDFVVNDSVWNIAPATLFVNGKDVSFHDVEIGRSNQYLRINGDFSEEPEKVLEISLKDIDLSYIFNVLDRKNIVFGGEATGNIVINKVKERIPEMYTDNFKVKDFSYNYCRFGDLDLKSKWEEENGAILLDGTVINPGIRDTKVLGRVFLKQDSLHFAFDANKLSLKFLRPFTQNILSNVDGSATGNITLSGKFKTLNVVGSAYVQDFNFGIDYLNTAFSITDSVFLDENGVYTDNALISDPEGHTGRVSMKLNHKNFKDFTYNIDLSRLNNFLVFNVTEKLNPSYYGKVYASGAGNIRGDTRYTNIDVNMRTNENSKFTYALLDEVAAGEYAFITYVDRDKIVADTITGSIDEPMLQLPVAPQSKHVMRLNLQIDATPAATVQLVIDTNTNDRITVNGEGAIRIEYNTNENMKMYGRYTVEKGGYNLNLQDLISKEFTVNPGSSITFRGDPMNAELDISAYYALQANLLDLDESFAQERDLNRTTVPVQTTMQLTGDLRRPEFQFDLNFPSLTQDIYRRVKNIISTDDMMNRQVLYLLALNKFYTPEYMNVGQTHSNELASVASSALSSQLNNILGQISDKFNIGTNFRSEKGDFTDLEFDVILSSQLLNNRLIFNGNLGYRDKSVNSNSFIGDFDLEYLINKAGTFRLKAYNHYNDKNYYIKSALTTQGVGIMFKKDFSKAKEIFQRSVPKRERKAKKAAEK